MSERTFSLDEAQTLLPILESLLRTAIDGKKLIEAVDAELQELAHRVFLSGGLLVNVVHMARRKAEREKSMQRLNGILHVLEVEMGDVIAGPVIILVQSIARDGLRHHSPFCQFKVVGALKEILFRMRVGNQVCSVLGQHRTKVGPLPSRQEHG